MCGILGKIDKTGRPVNTSIIHNYIQQIHRGTQGFGFAYQDKQRVIMRHQVEQEGILDDLNRYLSHAILFHHRIPTSTANVLEACHPFRVKIGRRSLYVIHNGVLQNEDELFKKHLRQGFTYRSKIRKGVFNDSEALAHELALCILSGKQDMEAEGSIAFIAFETDDNERLVKMHFGRNSGNPLALVHTNKSILVGSEVEGDEIPVNTLYTYHVGTGTITNRHMYIPLGWSRYSGRYGADWQDWQLGHEYDEYGRLIPSYSQGNWSKANEVLVLPQRRSADNIADLFGVGKLSDGELSEKLRLCEDEIMGIESINPGTRTSEEEAMLAQWHEYYEELSFEQQSREVNENRQRQLIIT